ncbi:MAG TPA: FecR family protein [Thermoanaerobaculia bacterium]|nr:FecR family protein [Thermoanaerobaculia bacterium]
MDDDTRLNTAEEALRELLESAGRRPAVPAEDLAAIQAAARAQWEEVVAAERKRKLRRSIPLALAASLLLAFAVLWWWDANRQVRVAEPIATVELAKGGAGRGPAVGEGLRAGATVTTQEDGLIALRLAGGGSVRLDTGTRVRLVSAERLDLEAGAVYVDSGPAGRGSLEVGTAWGAVREVGTQFEVRIESGDELRVRVREGAVSLIRGSGSAPVATGEEIRLRRDGSLSRGTIDRQGPAWGWVLAAAPGLDVDGLALGEYLDWVSRETGWRLRYEDEALAGLARGIRLRGTLEGMAPDESVSVVLPGSGLGYRIEGDTLLITRLKTPG